MIKPEDFYRGALEKEATDPARQGWIDSEYQNRMFGSVLGLVERKLSFSGLTVHDAGCGLGNLYPFLVARGATYIGTDMLPEMLAGAKERHPDGDFRLSDMRKDEMPEADVTLICGTLAFHTPEDAERMLRAVWAKSRKAISFVSWWDLPTNMDPERISWDTQKKIKRFIREIGWKRAIQGSMYGIPYETSFAIFKETE